jgi:hypothetical protein
MLGEAAIREKARKARIPAVKKSWDDLPEFPFFDYGRIISITSEGNRVWYKYPLSTGRNNKIKKIIGKYFLIGETTIDSYGEVKDIKILGRYPYEKIYTISFDLTKPDFEKFLDDLLMFIDDENNKLIPIAKTRVRYAFYGNNKVEGAVYLVSQTDGSELDSMHSTYRKNDTFFKIKGLKNYFELTKDAKTPYLSFTNIDGRTSIYFSDKVKHETVWHFDSDKKIKYPVVFKDDEYSLKTYVYENPWDDNLNKKAI